MITSEITFADDLDLVLFNFVEETLIKLLCVNGLLFIWGAQADSYGSRSVYPESAMCERHCDLDEVVFVDNLGPPVVVDERGVVAVLRVDVQADGFA